MSKLTRLILEKLNKGIATKEDVMILKYLADEEDDDEAMLNYGIARFIGHEVEIDIKEAKRYLDLAYHYGTPKTLITLSSFYDYVGEEYKDLSDGCMARAVEIIKSTLEEVRKEVDEDVEVAFFKCVYCLTFILENIKCVSLGGSVLYV